ncbi:helicase [Thermus phage phiYS40]|uniref:helicase n=1 Tax=Thermus phage phiYS40 TaxID=407392 RepID=UPI0000E689C5|nr:helicase [Thermus phage phiYS40]ABJ91473.1 helicase [Thermus phage phiYS40]BAK53597.1 helicase [Thermus phage phiYS40]
MKKIVYHLSQGDNEAEIHFILAKNKIQDYYIKAINENIKFALEQILEREIFYSVAKRNKHFSIQVFVGVELKTEEALFILPQILVWHGFKIEKVEKISDRTLKSLSLLEDIKLETEEEGVNMQNYIKSIEDILFSFQERSKDILLLATTKSINYSQFANEKGVVEKVPAGYIAYNVEDGRVLVGGKFLGVKVEQLEEGKPWMLIPANKNTAQALAKVQAGKASKEDVAGLIEASLQKNKKDEGIIDEILKEGVYFRGITEAKKKLLKDLLQAVDSDANKYLQQEKKLSAQNQKNNLDYVYVYDPENKYLTNLSTYLATKDQFSGKEVFFSDNLLKLRSQGASNEALFTELKRLLKIDSEEYERALDNLLTEIIQNPKLLNKRGAAQRDIDILVAEILGSNAIIPAGVLDIPTGNIIKLDDDTAKIFGLPIGKQKYLHPLYQEVSSSTIEEAAKILKKDISARVFERGKRENIPSAEEDPNVINTLFPEEERDYHRKLFSLFVKGGKFKEELDDLWSLLNIQKDAKGNLIRIDGNKKEILPVPKGNFGEKFPLMWMPLLLQKFGIIGYNSPKLGPISYNERIKFANSKISLQPYQVQALLKFLHPHYLRHTSKLENLQKVGMFIAHATGLGKTFTGLLAYALATNLGLHTVSYNRDNKTITFDQRPALAVMPESIAKGWIDDAETLFGWKVGQEIFVIEGNPQQRREKWSQLLDLWARANRGEKVNLPKMVIMKLSTFQKMESASAEDEADKYFLNLLSGPSIISHKGQRLAVPFGMFGMLLVDEASTIFSKSSARRRHIEDLSDSITSDANRGYTLLLNATAMSNSPKDFSSAMEMLFYQGHLFKRILGDPVIKTPSGPIINEDMLKTTATYLDVVGATNLELKGITLDIKTDDPLAWPTSSADPQKLSSDDPLVREPEKAKQKFEDMFLTVASTIYQIAKLYKEDRPVDTTIYDPVTRSKKSVDSKLFYEMYVPGFATLFSYVQGGAFTWERALEYGFTSFDEEGPFIIVDEENKPKNASVREIAIRSLVDTLSSVSPNILDRFGSNNILKHIIPKIKEYKTAEGEKKTKLKKEILELATKVPVISLGNTQYTFADLLSLGFENVVTHGLGSAEIEFDVDVNASRENRQQKFKKGFKIRFPGYAWNKKVDKEQEMSGTLKRRTGVSGLLEQRKQKTGSERKISIETRNKMMKYTFFITPMLSDDKHLYYPVIENTAQGEFRIRLAKQDLQTGVKTLVDRNDPKAAPFLNEDGTLNENFQIKQSEGNDVTLDTIGEQIGKELDKASYNAIATTEQFKRVVEEALKPFATSSKTSQDLGRKILITSPSTAFVKSLDYVFDNIRKNTPLGKMFRNLIPLFGDKGIVEALKRYYNGAVTGETDMADRMKIIESHNANNKPSITVLSRALARGVNMPSQKIVVHGATFSYETILQMLGRAFRPGGKQKGKVDASIILPQSVASVLGLKSFEVKKLFDTQKLLAQNTPILEQGEEEEYEAIMREREEAFYRKVVDALSNIITPVKIDVK